MKLKRIIGLVLIFTLMSSTYVFAKPPRSPIFMGEILEVQKDDNEKNTKLLVEGYIKSCDVYKEKLVAIITEETKVKSGCKVENEKVEFKKGDKVFIVLSEAMTTSIPPQATAKMIKVSKSA